MLRNDGSSGHFHYLFCHFHHNSTILLIYLKYHLQLKVDNSFLSIYYNVNLYFNAYHKLSFHDIYIHVYSNYQYIYHDDLLCCIMLVQDQLLSMHIINYLSMVYVYIIYIQFISIYHYDLLQSHHNVKYQVSYYQHLYF